MHHGTCVTHVPWCMLGSLTRGGGENVPGIPGACAIRNITYLVRGPWIIENKDGSFDKSHQATFLKVCIHTPWYISGDTDKGKYRGGDDLRRDLSLKNLQAINETCMKYDNHSILLFQLCAPMCLFFKNKEDHLMPIAIQLFPTPGPENPVSWKKKHSKRLKCRHMRSQHAFWVTFSPPKYCSDSTLSKARQTQEVFCIIMQKAQCLPMATLGVGGLFLTKTPSYRVYESPL